MKGRTEMSVPSFVLEEVEGTHYGPRPNHPRIKKAARWRVRVRAAWRRRKRGLLRSGCPSRGATVTPAYQAANFAFMFC